MTPDIQDACPYPGCGGSADGASCRHPRPDDDDGPAELGDCPSMDAGECAMIRERSVAGVSDIIPACPVHGAWPGDTLEG